MLNKIVVKFGGTSVKTESAIISAYNIIAKANSKSNICAIIVSAVGGATNLLLEFCAVDPSGRKALADQFLKIHLDLASALDLHIGHIIQDKIQRLYVGDLPDFHEEQIDHIVSLGEDLSSFIIYEFLKFKGLEIEHIDARQFMGTDDRFGRAEPDIKAIKTKLTRLVSAKGNKMFITQGFLGSTTDGKTTTLGRGGSDYSAALVAEALDANELFIYTDVPGVYTIDPHITKEAKVIEELSFAEMAEMANLGAKVLHPQTIEPCLRSNIPINILSTFEPEKGGTRISELDSAFKTARVHAITMRQLQILVTIKSLKMINAYGFLAKIFAILSKYKVSVDLITTSEVSVALTIDGNVFTSNPFHNKELIHELHKFSDVTIEKSLTLIAVIGAGLTTAGLVQSLLGQIEHKFLRLICYGASSSNIGILVPCEDAASIAITLHQKLLGSGN